jgi:hypothetical protein
MSLGAAQIADRFAEHCTYTLDQVLGDFWPVSKPDGGGLWMKPE